MKKNNIISLSADVLRILLIVLGCVFSTIVLVFSIFALVSIQDGNLEDANKSLLIIFIVLGLSRFVTFLKERNKISFFRFLFLLMFDVALGVTIMFAKDNPQLYNICGGLYCLSVVVSRLFKMFEKRELRSFIYNGLIIAASVLLAIGLFIPNSITKEANVALIICFVAAITAFLEVVSNASSKLKVRVLFKIVMRTFALEIILGLFTMMIASSLLLTIYEDGIPTFVDALWYSFAVVTTIGFGDFTAVTPLGRILTVLLGTYGIVVVAVITSIIVNFYNETAGKHDIQEIKEIKNDEKKK